MSPSTERGRLQAVIRPLRIDEKKGRPHRTQSRSKVMTQQKERGPWESPKTETEKHLESNPKPVINIQMRH